MEAIDWVTAKGLFMRMQFEQKQIIIDIRHPDMKTKHPEDGEYYLFTVQNNRFFLIRTEIIHYPLMSQAERELVTTRDGMMLEIDLPEVEDQIFEALRKVKGWRLSEAFYQAKRVLIEDMAVDDSRGIN